MLVPKYALKCQEDDKQEMLPIVFVLENVLVRK